MGFLFRWWGLAILGLGVVLLGVREYKLSGKSKTEPHTLTCAALGSDGPGKNAHVVMSDFVLSTNSYVSASRRGRVNEVWIPALPINIEWHKNLNAYFELDEEARAKVNQPSPRNFSVIVMSKEATEDDEVNALAEQDTLQGLVVNDVDSLGSDEKKHLTKSFPGVDLDRCWILSHKEEPTSNLGLLAYIGGALALFIASFVMFRNRRAAS